MRERQIALIVAILGAVLSVAPPAAAEKDAAVKAQEGEINHWIGYFRKLLTPQRNEPPHEERSSTSVPSLSASDSDKSMTRGGEAVTGDGETVTGRS